MERTNESIINLHKLSNAEHIEPSSDRISSLPDSVLCHILSFLPTKLSVATSTLARRWRFLWAYVLNLDFDSEDYVEYDDQITFPEIINRVMLLRNVWCINTLRIAYLEDFSRHELDTWIRIAITRNVQALDLYFSHQVTLPCCLFTCKTLVDLRLYGCIGIPGGGVCLPSLKKLHLRYVEYEGDKKLPRLISGCPVLEELIIENIFDDDIVCCIISSPTLKRLKLNFHYDLLLYIHNYELQINTPALRYLLVEDHLSEHISAGTMNSLVEANICLNNDMVKEDVVYSHSVVEFFERICQVECLRLSSSYVKYLDSTFTAPTTRFHNLTKLDLAADWRFLIKFLECADNLEYLIIREVDEDLKCWIEPQKVPVCLSSHLRTVRIYSFESSPGEFEMVRYILRKGKVLNIVEIHTPYHTSGSVVESLVFQTISNYQRVSGDCRVAFL